MLHMRNLVLATISFIWLGVTVVIIVALGICLSKLCAGDTEVFFGNLGGLCREARDFIYVYYQ